MSISLLSTCERSPTYRARGWRGVRGQLRRGVHRSVVLFYLSKVGCRECLRDVGISRGNGRLDENALVLVAPYTVGAQGAECHRVEKFGLGQAIAEGRAPEYCPLLPG